ncbi:hypothetical protein [Paenibacillus hexagrammi]|uniref:Uncharacterized protein n=1 Tax=Paenibacillus hexagrammi TaxID=2908839 RepID=A0ABY3SK98_9BACL|nr:hypothetical protein [Paenibacillus sp. YPD9-1]UJF33898.1 hypothetical protein L0M14_01165 [Paenibacillus sp. YPD9-1]
MPQSFKSLYLFIITYKAAVAEPKKCILYLEDEQANKYAKSFSMVPEVFMDQYDEHDIQALVDRIGKDSWYTIKSSPFL